MKNLYALLIVILLSSCGPSAEQITATAEIAQAQTQTAAPTLTPTLTPTITPTSTPASTPTPEFIEEFKIKSLGLPSDTRLGGKCRNQCNDLTQLTIEKGENHIEMYFYPASAQQQNNNNPIDGLISYINLLAMQCQTKKWFTSRT